MRRHSPLRRFASLSLVAGVTIGTALIGVSSASAGPVDVLPKPGPLTNPASIIVSVVGNVVPESGAARAAGMALEIGGNQAINTGAIGTTLQIAKYVPGFKAGYKVGEWISTAVGLYQPEPADFSDNFIPYENLVVADTGWTNGASLKVSYQGSPAGTIHCQPISGVVAGSQLAPGSPYMQCSAEGDLVLRDYRIGDSYLLSLVSNDYNGTWCLQHGQSPDPSTCTSTNNQTVKSPDTTFTVLQRFPSDGTTVPDRIDFPAGAQGPTSYNFPGSTTHPPYADSTPQRQIRTTATCMQADGSVAVSGYVYTDAFRETDAQVPSPKDAVCGSGVLVGSAVDLIDAATATGGPGDTIVRNLTTWTMPTVKVDWLKANPECWDGQCAVTLEQLKGGQWVNCFTDSAGCENWFDEPTKDQTFRCVQNGDVLALAECNMYSPTFNPTQLAAGIRYGDPATGAQVKPSTTPMDSAARQPLGTTLAQAQAAENPTTSPTTTPAPTTGGPGFPTSGTNPAGQPGDGSSCMGEGWSWNPLSWVFVPVKCAIVWAFVPSAEEVSAALGPMRDTYNASAVGAYLNGIGTQFRSMIPIGSDGDCLGPELAFTTQWTGHVSLHPLAACTNPVAQVAALTKLILTALVWFGVAVAAQAMILPALGFKPFLARGEKTDVLA